MPNRGFSNPEVSPDGRWLAYESNESGASEIFVRPFPALDSGRWQVSTGGGTRPLWSRDGRELFYLDASGFLTAVAVERREDALSIGRPEVVIGKAYVNRGLGSDLRCLARRAALPDDQGSSRSRTMPLAGSSWCRTGSTSCGAWRRRADDSQAASRTSAARLRRSGEPQIHRLASQRFRPSTKHSPSSMRRNRDSSSRPTRSRKPTRGSGATCVTFATEARARPVSRVESRTFPGAWPRSNFVVRGTANIQPVRLRFRKSA